MNALWSQTALQTRETTELCALKGESTERGSHLSKAGQCTYLTKNLSQNVHTKNPCDSKLKDNPIFKNLQNIWMPHEDRHTTG